MRSLQAGFSVPVFIVAGTDRAYQRKFVERRSAQIELTKLAILPLCSFPQSGNSESLAVVQTGLTFHASPALKVSNGFYYLRESIPLKASFKSTSPGRVRCREAEVSDVGSPVVRRPTDFESGAATIGNLIP